MGLDVSFAKEKLEDIRKEHVWQTELLKRNAEVLPEDYPLVNMFYCINDNLRFTSGMVRFEYINWSGVKHRIDGYVCEVTPCDYAASVKLLTEKGDMLTIFFPKVNAVQVKELPV